MAGILTLLLLGASLISPDEARANPNEKHCTQIQKNIDNYSQSLPSSALLTRVSPYMTAGAMPYLIRHLERADPFTRQAIYLAIGRARHSDSLRLLSQRPRPADSGDRLALSLSLLALGDGSKTGTIAKALQFGTVSERRMVSATLAQMKQVRPVTILKPALRDVDDVVRLAAVSNLGRFRSRYTRNILIELTKSDKLDVRRDAAALLVKWRHRLDHKMLLEQPEPMRSQMYVIAASRRSAQITRSLNKDVFSKDRLRRSASLASMVHVTPLKRFRRLQKRLRKRFGKDIEAELAMTLALYDDEDGWAALDKLDTNELERAVEVLAAYVGVGHRKAGLSVAQAERFGSRLEAWMLTGILNGKYESRVFAALTIMESSVALSVARKRILHKDGAGMRAALEILSQRGDPSDIPSIVSILGAEPSAKTRIEALIVAAKLCRY